MTSKHGDFFKSVESTPSDEASSLSAFLTGCKGKLCRKAFRFVGAAASADYVPARSMLLLLLMVLVQK